MEGCNVEEKEIEKIIKSLKTLEKDGTDLIKLHLGNQMTLEHEIMIDKIIK
jgi:hypothetical protein